jgi:glutamyl-tRNA reductase
VDTLATVKLAVTVAVRIGLGWVGGHVGAGLRHLLCVAVDRVAVHGGCRRAGCAPGFWADDCSSGGAFVPQAVVWQAERLIMKLFVAGISYKTAPVQVRERLAVTPSKLVCQRCRLKLCGGLDEVVVLSTCNRVEIYGVAARLPGRMDALFGVLTRGAELDVRPHVSVQEDAAAVRHLFRVASGLDSMVLGETEISAQVKHAYEAARRARLTGPVLNRVFQKALQTAKEIRSRTGIGRGATSVGGVAVELAEKLFGERLAQQTVIIIGAGPMGEACVRHLAGRCGLRIAFRRWRGRTLW